MGYKEALRQINIPLNNSSILVTGATGLIGSALIDTLIVGNRNGANNKIYALSRSEDRIKKRFDTAAIPIVQDITMPINTELEFDYIFHGASNADPRSYATQPGETVMTNILGTWNILEYCKVHNNCRLIMASTFEVYGKIDEQDIYKESEAGTIDFQVLRNGYSESKRCAEILVRCFVDEFGINASIVRLASIYGPTMLKSDSKAHAQFIRNALAHENIVLKSEGLQKRTYCYVLDAVSAIFKVLEKGIPGEAYNISNENSIATIADVARVCARLVGTKVVFELPDDIEKKGFSKPQNCILDNTKLKALGWYGKYTLEDGLKETLEYLESNRGI